MKAVKLITALALLGLHGAVGDDLCAPVSRSAARRVYAAAHRVYVGRASRAVGRARGLGLGADVLMADVDVLVLPSAA